jgi:hypothetical protein
MMVILGMMSTIATFLIGLPAMTMEGRRLETGGAMAMPAPSPPQTTAGMSMTAMFISLM